MKVFLKKILIILFSIFPLLFNQSVIGDIIYLKNGEVLEGYVVREDANVIQFDINNEARTIPKNQIKKVELGYSGIPICYKLIGSEKENCNELLYNIDDKNLYIAYGKGFTQLRIIDLKKISSYITHKEKEYQKISSVVHSTDMPVTLEVNGKKVDGKVKSITGNKITIEKDGKVTTYDDKDVSSLSWEKEKPKVIVIPPKIELPPPEKKFNKVATFLIPGLKDVRRNKLKAFFMFASIAAMAGGMASEYSAAVSAFDKDIDYFILDDQLYIFNNYSVSSGYNYHSNRFKAYSAGLGVLLTYHVYDWYSTEMKKTSVNIKLKNDVSNQVIPNSFQFNPGFEVRIDHQF